MKLQDPIKISIQTISLMVGRHCFHFETFRIDKIRNTAIREFPYQHRQ